VIKRPSARAGGSLVHKQKDYSVDLPQKVRGLSIFAKRLIGMEDVAPLVRVELVRERTLVYDAAISSPAGAARIANNLIGNADREKFLCLHLDIKNRVISVELVSVGSIDETIARPAEIFRAAILANAAAIVVAHNHPSGSLEPSSEDLSLTKIIATAGEILGVALMDHVIVNGESFVSLRQIKSGLFKAL
jgi:DNA repair protein RadC